MPSCTAPAKSPVLRKIAFIGLCYASLYLLIFNKLGLLKKTAGNIFAFAGVGVVIVGAIVFAWVLFAGDVVWRRSLAEADAWPVC